MRKRLADALLAFTVVYTVLSMASFFGVITYCILEPGGTGTAFANSPTDPVQEAAVMLWFLWGLLGCFAVWVAAIAARIGVKS